MDGVGFAGGEDGGDDGAAIGGEKLNGKKEEDREEEEAEGTEEVGNGFGDGLAVVAEEERDENDGGDDHRQYNAVWSSALPFFYHFPPLSLRFLILV